ncbi:MAG: dephospho-CoA kinase [Peptoniphilus sp.]|nr:dephospho-CoA kinase [Peptoniphilus sp.]MDD7363317.1 dephospho-CoA kinase [Bacillota bacterium]MDY6044050.1 dephospho-CoA kinase [Peptoniphilus sp.]
MNQNRIGITGTIASGKSALSSYLLGWDYMVIDADVIARNLVEPGSDLLKKIQDAFSEDDVIKADGSLDREKLGEIVFHDEVKREKLNDLMHPAIVEAMLHLISDKKGVVFLEIPLLFENKDALKKDGLDFDEIWLVDADPDVRIERLMKRDGIDEDYARQKIATQMPAEEKRRLADKVFDNSGDLITLYNQVDRALEELRGEEN